jgi:hypothetical protein
MAATSDGMGSGTFLSLMGNLLLPVGAFGTEALAQLATQLRRIKPYNPLSRPCLCHAPAS